MLLKKVNANSVCTCKINVHTSIHLQMCTYLHNYMLEIVQLVTHLGITAYSKSFPSIK